jgi:hypothetical protein
LRGAIAIGFGIVSLTVMAARAGRFSTKIHPKGNLGGLPSAFHLTGGKAS